MNYKLDDRVCFLKGVGPKKAEALAEVGVHTVWDLINYFPRRYIDRTSIKKVGELKVGETATVVGKVERFGMIGNRNMRGSRFVMVLSDGSGYLSCVWFRGLSYFRRAFSEGEWLAVCGRVEHFRGEWQMVHPEIDRLDDEGDAGFLHTGAIIPLYPSTEALREKWLDSRGMRRLIRPLLSLSKTIEDYFPEAFRKKHELIDLPKAYTDIHFPPTISDLQAAQTRLKFDELFFLSLMMAYRKRTLKIYPNGIAFEKTGQRVRELLERLPFELTEAQKQAAREIREDMRSPYPMNRLLQGDVGSGKTLVALIAMLVAAENGYQSAFMAPTEILAEQHYKVLQEYLWGMDLRVVLLKGKQSKGGREKILSDVSSHQADIVVGTHALFQESVRFARLGLIIIDEQHRFGVLQRSEIRKRAVESGVNPDVLVMTATPIPRTLAMTVYGDLDVSCIRELPKGRKPIRTVFRDEGARDKIYDFIHQQVRTGRQVYIVYPVIDQSEKTDLKAAVEAYQYLSEKKFPQWRVGLLHGRMKSAEKDQVMSEFKKGHIHILVCTTVIEVGVNVPNASVMMIEHANRFGLTQLHQLRGRVGRGEHEAYCILMAPKREMTDEAHRRIEALCNTQDGFKIAEEDLNIRGPGEFFGTRQSGMPELKMAHIIFDRPLLEKTRQAAWELISRDPQLRDPAHAALRKKFVEEYRDKFGLAEIA